ncbi:RNA-binding KH domain-containing protein PEPPER [Capsicum annuum]|uniref:RNA-binding KH domain-containing protein PEPPER n=1 Tax=Capsicum annuum TaxID=4072 RepID=A0A1U8H981_CAPAN|nr:RNA-binding KH domain-containing protein PEPPER [Capsicum annuum]KAF3633594.1 RNA-binding KH domain-containing protein PEPPER [Capsicum annuum]KAF3634072.1 RNA-binding KH domain-containing protein PEPPER [Capsicum annuum]PHT75724.1 RNA-binding KH domain-containing protein PEPPER [Capsicum annuum]
MASTRQTQNGSVVTQEPLTTNPNSQVADPNSLKNEPGSGAEVLAEKPKWPGWPGDCVFRLVVPVLKVGSIIGRKGELVKKMCEDTGAKIRVLDGPVSSPDRVVLISGKEETEAALSPAMDAVMRVFKRVSGLSEGEGDGNLPGVSGAAFCSVRLLVASTQAVNLIGKQGSLIKPIQQNTGASIRVLSNDEMSIYATSDERIVEIQGEALKVLKALESVIGHLRKFLVDHSVLPLFEKSYNTPAGQERETEPWSERTMLNTSRPGLGDYPPLSGLGDYPPRSGLGDYPPPIKRDTLFSDRESQLDSLHSTRLSLYGQDSGLSLYGQDPGLSGTRTSGLGRAGNSVITQISQTVQMQIPLAYAEDIIGLGGANIAYIRRTSGAILTVQESRGGPDEITVEIKGTSSQVQTAQQLIQESMSSHKESLPSSYSQLDSGLRQSSYSDLGRGSYPSSSFGGQQYGGGYGSFGAGGGGYSSYRS